MIKHTTMKGKWKINYILSQSELTPDLRKKNYLKEMMLTFESKSIVHKRKDCEM